MSAVKDMYEMKRGHYESVVHGEEYQKSLDEVIKCDDEMREALKKSPKLLELYKKATDALDALSVASGDDYYMEGFKFGVLMGLEIGRYEMK